MSDEKDMVGGLAAGYTGQSGFSQFTPPAKRSKAGRPKGKNDTPAAKREQEGRRARLQELIERRYEETQVLLAQAVGVDDSTLSKLLTGKRNISANFCRRVADVADVSEDWLLTGEGSLNTPAPPKPDRPRTDHQGENLRMYRERRNINKKALGERMGHSATTASSSVLQYEKSAQLEPSTKAALAAAFEIDDTTMETILSGKTTKIQTSLDDDLVEVAFISVRARASFARSLYDDTNYEEDMIKIRRDVLRPGFETAQARRGKVYITEVNGDSMEPTLYSGYRVSMYLIDPGDWQYATGVVVVCYRDEVVIKRIKENRLLLDGHLMLHSDNELGGSLPIPMSEIQAMFRVDQIVGGQVK